MTHIIRTALFAALVLATPLAFAQDTAAQAQTAQSTDVQAQDAAPMNPPANPDPAAVAAPEKKSWSDVDGNKDGALSRDEAASVPALGSVFDAADANADGSLTAEEYKAHVARTQQDGDDGTDAGR